MDITKIFTELDYTIHDINGECPPCTIIGDGRLIGFIREDFTVDIAEGAGQHREKIESIIQFGFDNFGLDEVNENEYGLISYDGYCVTTTFDTKEGIPVYNLCKETDEGYGTIEIYKSKRQAMKAFSEQSKLLLFLETETDVKEERIPSYFDIFKKAAEQIGLKMKASFTKLGILLHLKKDNKTVATIDKDLNVIVAKGIEKGLEKAIQEKVVKKAEEIRIAKKATHRIVPKQAREQTIEREVKQNETQSTVTKQTTVSEHTPPEQTIQPQQISQEKLFTDVRISKNNFPDANFRSYISKIYDGGDGVISAETLRNTTEMILLSDNINNLQGIEYFENLQFLACGENELVELDTSKNKELEILLCDHNLLTKLDVSRNLKLTTLACNGNSLTDLDLSCNSKLKQLHCQNNHLRKLDVSKNYGLKALDCSHNPLQELDITNNSGLEELNCETTMLMSLDLSANANLKKLNCENTVISTLSIMENEYLDGIKANDGILLIGDKRKPEKNPEKENAHEID